MSKFKAIIFDVDGVLILAPRMFSEIYCEKYSKDLGRLEPFYKSKEFQDSLIGKMDLKDAINAHEDKWQWGGDLEKLINEWLESENCPNKKLSAIIDELRATGTKIYIATAQEKYRANFLRNKVFSGMYDDFFATCDIGFHKHTMEFWQEVIKRIDEDPANIAYFDDTRSLVELAASLGIDAHEYTDVESVKQIVE